MCGGGRAEGKTERVKGRTVERIIKKTNEKGSKRKKRRVGLSVWERKKGEEERERRVGEGRNSAEFARRG